MTVGGVTTLPALDGVFWIEVSDEFCFFGVTEILAGQAVATWDEWSVSEKPES